jgi:hypothetical protein
MFFRENPRSSTTGWLVASARGNLVYRHRALYAVSDAEILGALLLLIYFLGVAVSVNAIREGDDPG